MIVQGSIALIESFQSLALDLISEKAENDSQK